MTDYRRQIMDRSAFFGSGSEVLIENLRADHDNEASNRNSDTRERDKHGILILQQRGSSDRQARQLKYAK